VLFAVAFGAVEAYMLFNLFFAKDSSTFIRLPKTLAASLPHLEKTLKKAISPGKSK